MNLSSFFSSIFLLFIQRNLFTTETHAEPRDPIGFCDVSPGARWVCECLAFWWVFQKAVIIQLEQKVTLPSKVSPKRINKIPSCWRCSVSSHHLVGVNQTTGTSGGVNSWYSGKLLEEQWRPLVTTDEEEIFSDG